MKRWNETQIFLGYLILFGWAAIMARALGRLAGWVVIHIRYVPL
jgi:hypothetical protein